MTETRFVSRERRSVVVRFTEVELLDCLFRGYALNDVVDPGQLPAECWVESVWYDFESRGFLFMLSNPTFAVVPNGERAPRLALRCARSALQALCRL